MVSVSEGSITEEVVISKRGEGQKTEEFVGDTPVKSQAIGECVQILEQVVIPSKSSSWRSSVGRPLPRGNSLRPSPWSHMTGAEDSHAETLSEASEYNVHVHQITNSSPASDEVCKEGPGLSGNIASIVQEATEEFPQHDTDTSPRSSSIRLRVKVSVETGQEKDLDKISVSGEDAKCLFGLSVDQSSLTQSHSKVTLSIRNKGLDTPHFEGDISGQIEAQNNMTSELSSKYMTKTATNDDEYAKTPTTNIQEFDGTESQPISYHHSSKSDPSPHTYIECLSSSMSYRDLEKEVNITDSVYEKILLASSQKFLLSGPGAISLKTKELISEHISNILTSISNKQEICSASYHFHVNGMFGMEERVKDVQTPIATPKQMQLTPLQMWEGTAILFTQPLPPTLEIVF
ncbi:uncharacterized protein LOC131958219 [Physella acuta]|uniref:uncharacterized protein LOC131958219 n=1 Tax=Physella acuta TaxID=109671 RepID=UPI0027DD9427|nr:uncharacterized protein LOC131958219 [Physella acuta]XP_059179091.1 uncharacterized protein LOC131958219 [Physella acuta]